MSREYRTEQQQTEILLISPNIISFVKKVGETFAVRPCVGSFIFSRNAFKSILKNRQVYVLLLDSAQHNTNINTGEKGKSSVSVISIKRRNTYVMYILLLSALLYSPSTYPASG